MKISDDNLMHLALAEAKRGTRRVRPNPKVGAALLTKDGQIVTGFHEFCGGPHAERNLINKAKSLMLQLEGATLAVTLEPCSHTGRTPPCADLILEEKISRVLVGVQDPHPFVAGRGLEKLRAAGLNVGVGVLEKECFELNKAWLTAHKQSRPYVRLKMATSLDGLWTAASGESQWITGPEARMRGHELRREVDAIITSLETVISDDPSLTARLSSGELSPQQPKLFLFTRKKASEGDFKTHKISRHPNSFEVLDGDQSLSGKFEDLYKKDVFDCLIEAGPTFASALLQEGLVNEVHLFMGARFLGGSGKRLSALQDGHLPGLEVKTSQAEVLDGGDLHIRLDL